MNSLYEKENLLPYVTEQNVPVAPKPSIFKPKLNKNGLSTAAFIFALSSIVLGIFIVPSVLGIALGTGALVMAIKRGLPKRMPIISMIISFVTLILSTIAIIFVFFVSSSSEPYIPPAYTYKSETGIAYKFNPISNIPCDSSGKCSFEVKLFPIDASKCSQGGTFTPDMQDLTTKTTVPAKPVSFPALNNGEEHTLSFTLKGQPNGRLIDVSTYPIKCS